MAGSGLDDEVKLNVEILMARRWNCCRTKANAQCISRIRWLHLRKLSHGEVGFSVGRVGTEEMILHVRRWQASPFLSRASERDLALALVRANPALANAHVRRITATITRTSHSRDAGYPADQAASQSTFTHPRPRLLCPPCCVPWTKESWPSLRPTEEIAC